MESIVYCNHFDSHKYSSTSIRARRFKSQVNPKQKNGSVLHSTLRPIWHSKSTQHGRIWPPTRWSTIAHRSLGKCLAAISYLVRLESIGTGTESLLSSWAYFTMSSISVSYASPACYPPKLWWGGGRQGDACRHSCSFFWYVMHPTSWSLCSNLIVVHETHCVTISRQPFHSSPVFPPRPSSNNKRRSISYKKNIVHPGVSSMAQVCKLPCSLQTWVEYPRG